MKALACVIGVSLALANAALAQIGAPTPAPAATKGGQEVRDSAGGWRVTLPEGWTTCPAAMLGQINAAAASMMPGEKIQYTHRFSEGGREGTTYILAQWTPQTWRGDSWEDI